MRGKTLSRSSCLERKNGRFVCEPSVLYTTLAKAAAAQRIPVPQLIFFCVVGLHGKAGAQARRTRADTRRRREAYPLWYPDRRQRRMCLRPSVRGAALPAQADRFFF